MFSFDRNFPKLAAKVVIYKISYKFKKLARIFILELRPLDCWKSLCLFLSAFDFDFDFSTLYTTIPHDKLKSKLKAIINQCFFHKNGNRRFQYVVIGYKDTYFVRDHSDAPQKYSDADVIKMLEYLIDHIFVEFGGRIFQ